MTADLIAEYDYSLEPLMHYRHRSCPASSNNWWTISGGPSESDLYCPNCGQRLSPAQYEPTATHTPQPAQELEL